MEIFFNIAQDSDHQYILNGLKEAANWLKIKEINHWQHWLAPSADLKTEIKLALAKKEFYLVQDENGERLAAFRQMDMDQKYWPKAKEKALYIHSFFVKRAYSGKQIGSLILKKIEKQLLLKEIPYLRLDCLESNAGLCQYYENQGFVKVGRVLDGEHYNALYEKKLY